MVNVIFEFVRKVTTQNRCEYYLHHCAILKHPTLFIYLDLFSVYECFAPMYICTLCVCLGPWRLEDYHSPLEMEPSLSSHIHMYACRLKVNQ